MKIKDFRTQLEKILSEMRLTSNDRTELLTMIAAHESLGCTEMKQIGGGPARGPFGMEKFTHDEIWKHSDSITARAKALGIKQDFNLVETDMRYAVIMAVSYLLMDANALPKTFHDRAAYAKKKWNAHGKATPEEYLRDLIYWERGIIG